MAAVCDSKFKFSPFHCFVCCLLQIARCLSFAVFRAFCRAASRLVLCSPVFNLVISLLAHSDRKSCLQSRLQSGHSSQSGLQSPSVSPTIVLAILVCIFVFSLVVNAQNVKMLTQHCEMESWQVVQDGKKCEIRNMQTSDPRSSIETEMKTDWFCNPKRTCNLLSVFLGALCTHVKANIFRLAKIRAVQTHPISPLS